MKLIYLATPYSHEHPAVRESRFREACRIAAYFMRRGYHVFSPIAHTHPIAEAGDLPKGWDYWRAYDRAMLFCCNELWVVEMAGWETSVGIKGEIEIARELGLPIKRVRYADDTIGCGALVVTSDEPGFPFPALSKAVASAQRCVMCDQPLDPGRGESAGAGCRDCTEFAIESVGAVETRFGLPEIAWSRNDDPDSFDPGGPTSSPGSVLSPSRTSTGLTAGPDPGYDRDMATTTAADRSPLPPSLHPRSQAVFGFSSGLGAESEYSHWLRENWFMDWPKPGTAQDLDALDSAPEAVQEPRSVSGEGDTSAQTPDREPQTAPGAWAGHRVYGYGIVDRDGIPWRGKVCTCDAICETRPLIDDRCDRLNEHAAADNDERAPYRVVRLLIDADAAAVADTDTDIRPSLTDKETR